MTESFSARSQLKSPAYEKAGDFFKYLSFRLIVAFCLLVRYNKGNNLKRMTIMAETEENVTYPEIHAYMLRKTQEYYQNPPAVLVADVIAQYHAKGIELTYDQAKSQVSLIEIQRYLKKEMTAKWPKFMSGIKSNSLR